MSERFMRLPEVIETVGLCKAEIYGRISRGQFPEPVKLGRVSVWVLSEVEGWKEKNGVTEISIKKSKALAKEAEKHQILFDERSNALTGRSIRSTGEIVRAAKKGADIRVSGVYFLVKDEEVVYVGQSVAVHSRVATHYNSKDFDSWSYIPCEKSGLDILESLYIHFLQPKLNGKTGQTDQLGAPVSLDDLLKRVTLRRAA